MVKICHITHYCAIWNVFEEKMCIFLAYIKKNQYLCNQILILSVQK